MRNELEKKKKQLFDFGRIGFGSFGPEYDQIQRIISPKIVLLCLLKLYNNCFKSYIYDYY